MTRMRQKRLGESCNFSMFCRDTYKNKSGITYALYGKVEKELNGSTESWQGQKQPTTMQGKWHSQLHYE